MRSHVHTIIAAVSEEAIREKTGVSEFAVKHAKSNRVFPASWYKPVKELCEIAGVECPLEAFNWKSPSACASQSEAS